MEWVDAGWMAVVVVVVWLASRAWSAVRMRDAQSRIAVADLRAERYRIDRDKAIADAVSAGVAQAMIEHRAQLEALSQDIRDQRSRVAMAGRK